MGKIQPIRLKKKTDLKWGHAFSLGFSVHGQNTGEIVTEADLLKGMEKRIEHLRANPSEIFAACGFPEESGQGEKE